MPEKDRKRYSDLFGEISEEASVVRNGLARSLGYLLGDRDEALQVIDNALFEALKCIDLSKVRTVASLLYKEVARRILKLPAANKEKPTHVSLDAINEPLNTSSQAGQSDLLHFLSQAVKAEEITKEDRDILVYLAQGESHKDISVLFGLTEATVSSRIHRARKKLKKFARNS